MFDHNSENHKQAQPRQLRLGGTTISDSHESAATTQSQPSSFLLSATTALHDTMGRAVTAALSLAAVLVSPSASSSSTPLHRRNSDVVLPINARSTGGRGTSHHHSSTTHHRHPHLHHPPSNGENSYEAVSSASTEVEHMPPRGGDVGSGALGGLVENLKICFYFALWYALNVVYNIVNKKVLNTIPAPLTVGTIQFLIGALYCSSIWILGIRPTPRLTSEGQSTGTKIGFYHMAGQLCAMVSMGAGPISFTHIVKALEPFFSAAVSVLVFGTRMKPQVYATLIPVVGGVAYACMKEHSFSWLAFYAAMGSNLAFAFRAVVSKSTMGSYIGENLSAVNLFGVVTWFAFILSVPVMLLLERGTFLKLWSTAVDSGVTTSMELSKAVLLSGLFHYLNNEVMFLALGNVHPVTLAVGNTMKRVFILVASVLVFRNPVSFQAAVGSAVGISGVLLYSLTKAHYEKLEAAGA